jgi:hypothetical protein
LLSFEEESTENIVAKKKTSAHDYFDDPEVIQPLDIVNTSRSPPQKSLLITEARTSDFPEPPSEQNAALVPIKNDAKAPAPTNTLDKIAAVEAEIRRLNKPMVEPQVVEKPLTALQQLQSHWKGKLYKKTDKKNPSVRPPSNLQAAIENLSDSCRA